jgi:FtsZ-binding cell division protein ZapB
MWWLDMRIKILLSMLIASLIIVSLIVFPVKTYSEETVLRFLFIYAPGFNINTALNMTDKLEFLKNSTFQAKILPEPPYTLVYHEALIVNNTWNLGRAIVFDNYTALLSNNTVTPLYRIIPTTILGNIWGFLDTLFVDVGSINPKIHSRAVNPYYNSTNKIIEPTIFVIPINGTTYWKQLNTTIHLTVSKDYYTITIKNYVGGIKFSRKEGATPPLKINITNRNLGIAPGIYYLVFRVVSINNTHIILFTPGTRMVNDWYSEYYSTDFQKFDKPIVPRIPLSNILEKLGSDDLEWLINETIDFYDSVLSNAYKYRSATINFIEYPLIYDLYNAYLNGYISDEELNRGLKLAYYGLYKIIETTRSMINENITIMIYSPFTFLNRSYEKLNIEGTEVVEPGLLRVTSDLRHVVSELVSKNVAFKLFSMNNRYYVLINDPKYFGKDMGQLIIWGVGLRKILGTFTLSPENIASFIISMSRGYSVGLTNAINQITLLNIKISDLKSTINDLNNKIKSLNNTLFHINMSLGKCNAEKINITNKIMSLREEIEKYRSREEEALTYAITGSISVFIILAIIYLIGYKGVKKK